MRTRPAMIGALMLLTGGIAQAQSVDAPGAPATASSAPSATATGSAQSKDNLASFPPGKTAPPPVSPQVPYVVPAHPQGPFPTGDDGKIAGKSNPD